jgi:hypothetical protein
LPLERCGKPLAYLDKKSDKKNYMRGNSYMRNVSLKEIAEILGLERTTCRSWLLKNGFKPIGRGVVSSSRGSYVSLYSPQQLQAILQLGKESGFNISADKFTQVPISFGYLYAIQLEPKSSPNRIRLGFTVNTTARLARLQAATPTAILLKRWGCRRTWKGAAIDSITRTDCKVVASNVFEFASLEELIERGNAFFALMPDPEILVEAAQQEILNS